MGSSSSRLLERLRMAGSGLRVVFLLLVAACAGMFLIGLSARGETEEYSAYSDPEKTALAVILSEEQNVQEFQREFGLDDEALQEVLAAVREENEKLANEYAQSEKIVSSHRALPEDEIAGKISASDYDETVEGAISATKDSVTEILPKDDEPQLQGWVDEQWRQEVETASTEDFARLEGSKAGGQIRCKVFATQYRGYTRFEIALPHRALKFGSQPRVKVRRVKRDKVIKPRVKEVGPWNTRDNYWSKRENRAMWRNLPRCRPEAQAAYYRNYNRGKDEFGREVLNPAGADLTPAAARRMGLKTYQNAWIYVKFPWVRR